MIIYYRIYYCSKTIEIYIALGSYTPLAEGLANYIKANGISLIRISRFVNFPTPFFIPEPT